MKIPDNFTPLLIKGEVAKFDDVKTWHVVDAWHNKNLRGEAGKMVHVKCTHCNAETFFSAKSIKSKTAATCTHDPYAPVGQNVYGEKALPTKLCHTWGVLSYIPGSKDVKGMYNVECVDCGKQVQFVSSDFRPERVAACNHDLDVKQGVGSDHAWWARHTLPEDKKGWKLIYMHPQEGNKKANFECKCSTCGKIAFFNTSNYRSGSIAECDHDPTTVQGIGSREDDVGEVIENLEP